MAATVSTRITRLAAISPRTVVTNLQADLTIGDFRLGADYMRDAANSFGLSSTVSAGDDVRFWAGATFTNRATAPFRLTEAGALFASNATIAGAITASTIDIGGADATSFHVDVDGNLWSGAALFADGPFKVSNAGALTASSGTVGGWTLGASSFTGGDATLAASGNLTLGTVNDLVRLSADDATYRLWIGHATAASAPFRVTKAGALIAASVTTAQSTADTAVTNAATAQSAAEAAAASAALKLAIAGGDILTGIIDVQVTTNYNAGIRVGDVTWNTTTGAVTGGSGVVMTRLGLIGVKAGATNFSITTAGDVTMSGTVTAIAGAIGGFTLSATQQYAGTAGTRIQLDTAAGIHLGATAFADAPFSVTLAGLLKAASGTVGGWVLGSTSIADAAGVVGLSSAVTVGDDIRLWAGNATPASAPFRVTEAGVVTASSGTIGGFTLSATQLYSGTGVTRFMLDTGQGLSLGDNTFASAPFSVTYAGVMKAASGTVGGWTRGADYIRDAAGVVGISSAVTAGDDIRFWAGHATMASAPFRVTEAGVLSASGATISGSITATTGAIGGFTVGADYIRDAADSFGLASTATGATDDIRFWAGAAFADRATAPVRIDESGKTHLASLFLSDELSASLGITGDKVINAGHGSTMPAGGNLDVAFKLTSGLHFGVFCGSGAPTLSAAKGSLYLRSDGTTTNNRAYVNTNGTTTWTALTTAA